MATMIKFNGVDLTDNIPVKIDDITVSPIQLNPLVRQRAIAFGSEFISMNGGTRTVSITFALLDIDSASSEAELQAIRDWAFSTTEKTLELPQFENRYLECICTQFPDASFRKWWENKLRLSFTCYNNPYWTSSELIEVPCGTQFSVGGSASPIMTIERTGLTALTNQTYSNGTESMTFSTVPAGSFKIDLNRQTAQIGNTSVMRYYVPSSSWIVPKVGAYQRITGAGVVKYRERWL
jgi:phage-related protein